MKAAVGTIVFLVFQQQIALGADALTAFGTGPKFAAVFSQAGGAFEDDQSWL
jgi:hypothetical protein